MSQAPEPTAEFWRGRRVLLTGHTGFKGAWLAILLHRLGAKLTGVALAPATSPSLFGLAEVGQLVDSRIADIRNADAMAGLMEECQPEIVFHLAAQSLVRPGYREPLLTFDTNVNGTASVLESVRVTESARVVVAITTDKVYVNRESAYPYRESDALGGHDPYSASKAAAEIVIASYRSSFLAEKGVAIASARAGNVIGGGDWSEDRLIPDAVRAWSTGQALPIRRPQAIRPWQHVLEPLAGYVRLAERLWDKPELAGAYNFGPHTNEAATVREVVQLAQVAYGAGEVRWEQGDQGPHEAGWLALEIAKARHVLNIEPRWSLEAAVTRTMRWYRRQSEGARARDLCLDDIKAFFEVGGKVPAP